MASNSFFVAFSHDNTFTNGIKSDLYMGFHGWSDIIVSLELSITVCFGKVGPMRLFDKSAHLWLAALFWYALYCIFQHICLF